MAVLTPESLSFKKCCHATFVSQLHSRGRILTHPILEELDSPGSVESKHMSERWMDGFLFCFSFPLPASTQSLPPHTSFSQHPECFPRCSLGTAHHTSAKSWFTAPLSAFYLILAAQKCRCVKFHI